jgi:flagellar L-ring protein precursor FlgH
MSIDRNRTSGRVATALVALTLLCAGREAFAQGRPGSIYKPGTGPIGMIADRTARRPGDLLTVLIEESQDLTNEETANLKKQTSLDYALTSFNIKPSAFDILPDLEADSTDDFQGTANYKKKGSFVARITTIVMDVLPNGCMVIQGRREIRIDNETKLIEFSGIVRAYDISADNTIASELVAEARVSYTGEGALTNATNRTGIGSVIHDFIAWLWPF